MKQSRMPAILASIATKLTFKIPLAIAKTHTMMTIIREDLSVNIVFTFKGNFTLRARSIEMKTSIHTETKNVTFGINILNLQSKSEYVLSTILCINKKPSNGLKHTNISAIARLVINIEVEKFLLFFCIRTAATIRFAKKARTVITTLKYFQRNMSS
jgi:hypothetical protein